MEAPKTTTSFTSSPTLVGTPMIGTRWSPTTTAAPSATTQFYGPTPSSSLNLNSTNVNTGASSINTSGSPMFEIDATGKIVPITK
jgi:hypothetical protein